jgi:hypothetical protein
MVESPVALINLKHILAYAQATHPAKNFAIRGIVFGPDDYLASVGNAAINTTPLTGWGGGDRGLGKAENAIATPLGQMLIYKLPLGMCRLTWIIAPMLGDELPAQC